MISNTSKLLFSQALTTTNIKTKTSQGADSAFKSVFENTVNSKTKSANDRTMFRRENDISQKSETKVKYNSFKEVARDKSINNNQSSVKKTDDTVTTQNVDSEIEELKNNSKEYDETINVFAQMLGIQPDELVKIANELGFSTEDLKNADNLSLFMDKLANVLELNDSQKAMLNALAVEIPKQVGTEANKENASNANISNGNQIEANTDINELKTVDLSKISDAIKNKLDQLIQNAEIVPESLSAEISKVVEAMRAQAGVNVTITTEQDDVMSANVAEVTSIAEQVSEEGTVNKAKEESAQKDNTKFKEKSDNADTTDTQVKVDANNTNAQVTTSNDQNYQQNQQNAQVVGDVKINLINNQTQAQKAEFSMPQPVRTSEVINQVVEQAKVVLGQDKSEMVIHLKPDHLGKLELKVVTEQGIVAAKFVAENNQVKEIIEANMQLLKDALEKQGLSIDNVSVQVGQEKQNEFAQQSLHKNNNKGSSNNANYSSNELSNVKNGYNVLDTLPERLAQYGNETNTISFTA